MTVEEEKKKFKIAIVKFSDNYRDYGDDGGFTELLANAITDFEEVTEQEFIALTRYAQQGKYVVVTPVPAEEVKPKAVKDYLAYVARMEKQQKEYQAQNAKRLEKSRLSREANARRKLEKLAAAAGVKLVPKTEI